jgi:hypothetical protein
LHFLPLYEAVDEYGCTLLCLMAGLDDIGGKEKSGKSQETRDKSRSALRPFSIIQPSRLRATMEVLQGPLVDNIPNNLE